MAEQKTITIGQGFAERQRTTSSGTKSRFTTEIKAETVDVDLDEKLIAGPVALVLKDVLEKQIKAISEPASSGTILARKYAADAVAKDAPWAMRRYSGGKTGLKSPGKSDNLFNDSGRLAEGLSVRANPSENAFTINVPSNRFDPSTFASEASFREMLFKFKSLVPALAQPEKLLDNPDVQKTLKDGLANTLIHKNAEGGKSIVEAVKATRELFAQVDETVNAGED